MKILKCFGPKGRPIAQPSTPQHLVSSTRGQPIHRRLYIPLTNNGAPECEENGERKRAVEDNPHGFWYRFGAQPAGTAKDGICRAFRPVVAKLAIRCPDDFAHHSIRFGNIPEIGSWQKRSIPRERSDAPKVAIVGAQLELRHEESMPPLGRVVHAHVTTQMASCRPTCTKSSSARAIVDLANTATAPDCSGQETAVVSRAAAPIVI